MKLNEQLNRMKNLMGIKESFEISNVNEYEALIGDMKSHPEEVKKINALLNDIIGAPFMGGKFSGCSYISEKNGNIDIVFNSKGVNEIWYELTEGKWNFGYAGEPLENDVIILQKLISAINNVFPVTNV